jgi:hypothetical protein
VSLSEQAVADAEIYHRLATSIRVARDPRAHDAIWTAGREEGTAVRVRTEDGRLGFAAAAAAPARCVPSLLDRARTLARSCSVDARWAAGGDDPAVDRDGGAHEPPAAPEVAAWLEAAIERVADVTPGAAVEDAWVEIASTCESLVASGLRASRLRRRYWALLVPRDREGRVESPVQIAGRRWPPDTGAFASALADRRGPAGEPAAPPRRAAALVLAPEPAAALVLALTRSAAAGPDGGRLREGMRWIDEPGSPLALFGGSFDDAGFPTRSRTIAGDGPDREPIDGPGTYRRPSFREEPRPLPSRIAVPAVPVALEGGGVLATDLRIHPLGRSWALVIEGSLLDGDRPVRPIRSTVLRVDPLELLGRLVGTIGPARESYRGVRTPALVLADIVFR